MVLVPLQPADGDSASVETGKDPGGARKRWWLVAAVAGALLVAAVVVSSQFGSDSGGGDADAADDADAAEEDFVEDVEGSSPVEVEVTEAPAADSAPTEQPDQGPPSDEPTDADADDDADDDAELSEAFGKPEHPVSGVEPYVPSRIRLDEPGPPADVCMGVLPAQRVQLPLRFASTRPESEGVEQLSWSPDCRRMVFRVGRSLWVADGDGTSDMPFLTAQHGLSSPAWSPDGQWLAFSQGALIDGERASHIYVVRPDALGLLQITDGVVFDEDPAWSPDGERLAFSRRIRLDDREIAGEVAEFIVVVEIASGDEQVMTAGGLFNRTPSWSPDGELLTYLAGSTLLALRPGELRAQELLVEVERPGAAWSPDGSRVAAFRDWYDGQTQIVVRDLPGLEPGNQHLIDVQALAHPSSRLVPALRWSETGEYLLFHATDARGGHWAYRFAVPSVGG